ncbi:MAG: hypothetical protein GXX99_06950 [Clostridiales bacterium]|nr:hypothetical protein [Clostridiales bacterium]
MTVDGDVTVTGQGVSGEVEAVSAGGFATVTVGGHVKANRATDTQVVTAISSNGSTVVVGKNVATQGNGVNVQNDGHVTIEGMLHFNPTGTGSCSYIKLGYPVVTKTADDVETPGSRPGYKEYKNGANIVWIKGAAQLGKPAGLAWDSSASEFRATWSAVPNAVQYKVNYYQDGSKLDMSTNVNAPNTSTDDVKDGLLGNGAGSYTFTVQAMAAADSSYLDSDVSAPSDPPYLHGVSYHTVTFDLNGGTRTGGGALTQSIASGGSATAPKATRHGYTFAGWDKTFTHVTSDLTVTARWSPNGGGGSPAPSETTYRADVKEGNGAETTLPVTVNPNDATAFADTGTGKLSPGETVVTMPKVPGVDTYCVGIPVPELSTSDAQGTLTLHTGSGIVTVPSNMLTDVPGISGSKAQIAIGQGDGAALPEEVKAAIGNRPLVRLALSIDGRQTAWANLRAPVTVSIPYVPTAAELAAPEGIVVWYIDGSGSAVCIPNGRYDPAMGTVTFSTTHFSNYAVAYNRVSFDDVAADAWYHRAVSFIAARNITGGTGNGHYSPEARLTRGDFIVLLMRAYGIDADEHPVENFADAGNTYYTGHLAAAKRLGIATGVGNDLYAPGREITRQEMFTLLYNALKVIDRLPQGSSGKALSDFEDAGQIASWTQEAMALLVKTGTVSGSGQALAPLSTTSRAEMAQVLYNLLGK